MFGMVLGLMPACKAADASYLMGVFIAGLTFANDHEVHHFFGLQFKRVLQVSSDIGIFVLFQVLCY